MLCVEVHLVRAVEFLATPNKNALSFFRLRIHSAFDVVDVGQNRVRPEGSDEFSVKHLVIVEQNSLEGRCKSLITFDHPMLPTKNKNDSYGKSNRKVFQFDPRPELLVIPLVRALVSSAAEFSEKKQLSEQMLQAIEANCSVLA